MNNYFISHNKGKIGGRVIKANSVTFENGFALFLTDDKRKNAGIGAQKISAMFSLKDFYVIEDNVS